VGILGAVAVSGLLSALAAADVAGETAHSPIRPPGLWHWVWLVGVTAAFASYAVAIWLLRSRRVALGPILVVAAVMQLAPLSGPLLLSTDVYSYWSFGRLAAVHHVNPYDKAPSDVLPRSELGSGQEGTTIYGPGFTAASEGHALLVGDSARDAEVVYRIAAAAGVLVLLSIVALGVERSGFPVAFIGWSPLFALHFAGGGHNDIWMLVFVVGGVVLARRLKPMAAGIAWACSAFVKVPALIVLPLEVVATARREGPRTMLRLVGGLCGAAALLGALATIRYGTGWLAFVNASSETQQLNSLSLVYRLVQLGIPHSPAKIVLGVLFGLGYLLLGRDAWKGRARLALAANLLVLTPAWVVPWYGSWPVALAAIEDDTAAQVLAVVTTAYLLTDALPLPF
jgi:hypothetical protein